MQSKVIYPVAQYCGYIILLISIQRMSYHLLEATSMLIICMDVKRYDDNKQKISIPAELSILTSSFRMRFLVCCDTLFLHFYDV